MVRISFCYPPTLPAVGPDRLPRSGENKQAFAQHLLYTQKIYFSLLASKCRAFAKANQSNKRKGTLQRVSRQGRDTLAERFNRAGQQTRPSTPGLKHVVPSLPVQSFCSAPLQWGNVFEFPLRGLPKASPLREDCY